MKRLTAWIIFRVTPEERAYLEQRARDAKTGKNFSGYLRNTMLANSGYRNPQLEKLLKDVQYELRKIGTNVNQIAKKINGGLGEPEDIRELERYLNRIGGVFEAFSKEAEERGNYKADAHEGESCHSTHALKECH